MILEPNRKAFTIMVAMRGGAKVWVQHQATRREAWEAAIRQAETLMHPRDGHEVTAVYVIAEDETPLDLPTDRVATQEEINAAIERAAVAHRLAKFC